MERLDHSEELLSNLSIDERRENNNDESINRAKSQKVAYKERKIEHKLNKYESILKNLENINRVENESSKYLFVGNCGLDNNVSREFLENTFKQFGNIIEIIMEPKKSYCFIVFAEDDSCSKAIKDLQGKTIDWPSQTPICYYLFPVDKVPTLCSLEKKSLPDGLINISNFIDEQYGKEIVEFFENDGIELSDLKHRKVKHYGYEFRYGTNDCDETKPLDSKIPKILDRFIERCLSEKLIDTAPDQLTVNYYEPGQGIPPHVDNINAFDNYIISLSLISDVVMEFRLKNGKEKLMDSVCLKANSLLVLKSDARYKWSHSIAERKHDLILNEKGNLTLVKREKRMSLTFRKLITTKSEVKAPEDAIKLPESEKDAITFEKSYVHTIYNQIAEHFSNTRHSAWPGVAHFIEEIPKYSTLLDVGCGNGKYLNLRNDIYAFGCDYSTELISICSQRGFNVFASDCLHLACLDNSFDNVICIAVLHHLSTKARRVSAIQEMLRVLKIGGRGLVTVWAKEQKLNNQESYYIQKNKSKKQQSEKFRVDDAKIDEDVDVANKEEEKENSEDFIKKPQVHEFGKPFEKQDLFVTWHYKKMNEKKKEKKEEAAKKDDQVYLRYYHVFQNKELESLFEEITNARVIHSYYEQGNWCAVFEKLF